MKMPVNVQIKAVVVFLRNVRKQNSGVASIGGANQTNAIVNFVPSVRQIPGIPLVVVIATDEDLVPRHRLNVFCVRFGLCLKTHVSQAIHRIGFAHTQFPVYRNEFFKPFRSITPFHQSMVLEVRICEDPIVFVYIFHIFLFFPLQDSKLNTCVSRTISQYFNHINAKGEQRLVEDLIIEAIRLRGMEVYYVPRTLVKADPVFGEDPLSKFEKVFPIEMYFDNPGEGWQGDRYLISKFGMEMRETANFIVSRRRFNECLQYDGFNSTPITQVTDKEVRPKEGDLIYLPVTNDLFIINFAEHESVFYQLGYRYIWRIDVQKYDYSHETINTGKPEIDRVQQFFENMDSVTNDPVGGRKYDPDDPNAKTEYEQTREEGAEVINTTEKNIFGDPL